MTVSICSTEGVTHAVKGTGDFFAAAGCSVALAVLAVVTPIFVLGALIAPFGLCFQMCQYSYLNLIWAVPISLLIFTCEGCCMAAKGLGLAKLINDKLVAQIRNSGDSMLHHFRAIGC